MLPSPTLMHTLMVIAQLDVWGGGSERYLVHRRVVKQGFVHARRGHPRTHQDLLACGNRFNLNQLFARLGLDVCYVKCAASRQALSIRADVILAPTSI